MAGVSEPIAAMGTNQESVEVWMRMRTPSPDYTMYRGREPPAPPQALLEYSPTSYGAYMAEQPMFMPASYSSYMPYKPYYCLMPMTSQSSVDDSMSTDIDTSASRTSSCQWSSGASDGVEVQSHESDFLETCQPCMPEIVMEITAANAPSPGSIGHPHHCEAACKYVKKPKGCKDGHNCSRCHLCDFRNSKVKKEAISTDSVAVSPPSTLGYSADSAALAASRKQGRHGRSRKGAKQDVSSRS
jgi:hypothetical protein